MVLDNRKRFECLPETNAVGDDAAAIPIELVKRPDDPIALEAIKKPDQDVLVYSDSKYVIEAVEKKWVHGWASKDFVGKKNKDLWLRFLRVYKTHRVKFQWVRGHAGHPENERCDRLAVGAYQKQDQLGIDEGFELTLS